MSGPAKRAAKPAGARPRIDLDGVALLDPAGGGGPAIAIFRYRTTAGLVLLIPESADFLVGWEHLDEVVLDLASGALRVRFAEAYAAEQHWLRGARVLEGRWTDRCKLEPSALGL
ncbi:MAG: hypothetical protein AB7N76_17660 [Planctomycetota bacterium]